MTEAMKEVVVSKTTHKDCRVCKINYVCNLQNFPKNTTRVRDGFRITYLKSTCRSCWRKRPNQKKPTKEQYQKHSLNYYYRNRDRINRKKRRETIERNLNKFLIIRLEKEAWKNRFKSVVKHINDGYYKNT
jgi:hypothetical protein